MLYAVFVRGFGERKFGYRAMMYVTKARSTHTKKQAQHFVKDGEDILGNIELEADLRGAEKIAYNYYIYITIYKYQ